MGKKCKEKKYIITSRFVQTSDWQKEYRDGMVIFIRMLERAAKESTDEVKRRTSLSG